MPRITVSEEIAEEAAKVAKKIFGPKSKICPLPEGSTEVFSGEPGKITVHLHSKPERTEEMFNLIKTLFEDIEKGVIVVSVIPSDESKWIKF